MTAKVDAILVANDIRPDEEHLEQHGVKGMKWGVRKRRSASVDKAKSQPSTTVKESRQVQRTSDRSRGAGKANSFAQKPQNRRMSDAELRSRLNRLQMEKQYRELTTSPKGKSFVRDVLEDTGKTVARQVVKTSANVALEMAFKSLAKDAKAGSFVAEMAAQIAKKGGGKKN